MEAPAQRPQWGDRERVRWKAVRRQLGDTQMTCSQKLQALGAPVVSLPTVSQWATGAIKRPPDAAIEAIASYCEGVELSDGADLEAEPAEPGVRSASIPATTRPALFSEVISPMTGERPLSDRQARLLDAVIDRLGASAGPLSPDDGRALRWAADVVGLGGLDPSADDDSGSA